MGNRTHRGAASRVLWALALALLLAAPAAAGEGRSTPAHAGRGYADKTVRLQLRISEARRKHASRRYFQGVARRIRAGSRTCP